MDWQEFIKPELLILIPVLNVLGLIFKTSSIKNKYIPLILGIISVAITLIWSFSTCGINEGITDILKIIFISITQGTLIAGTAVYAHQLYTQNKKEE